MCAWELICLALVPAVSWICGLLCLMLEITVQSGGVAGRCEWQLRRFRAWGSWLAARWAGTCWRGGRSALGAAGPRPARGALRFAFYGRVSTEDYQDPVTSRARQRDQAGALVAGYGRIVAEYFDAGRAGCCRGRRPQAAALVAAMADPDRGFDAIVVG